MSFNSFYIAGNGNGNGNERPPQVSCLLVYFACDVNMTSLSWHWWAATASATCVIDDVILTNGHYACVLVFVPKVDTLNIFCECQFVLSVLDELCFTPRLMHWVISKSAFESMQCDVSFSQGSVYFFTWGEHVFHVV